MNSLSKDTIQSLTQALEANQRVMNRLMERLEKQDSPWVDPDEAARLLGLPLSKSRNHRRKVAYLAKQGFIPKFRHGRPSYYWREDLLLLQPKIAKGEVVIPSRV